MTNSDTTHGTFNKTTREYKIHWNDDDSVVTQSFGGNVETAKSFFFTDDALTCWNNNSTNLQWAITSDGNGLKVTHDFGTKGSSDQAESGDWAATWTSTKNSLISANNWIKSSAFAYADKAGDGVQKAKYWKATDSSDHLF
jgi:hypothetical protein